jgi:hypothetical protein
MSQKNVEAFEQANDRRDVEAVIEETYLHWLRDRYGRAAGVRLTG